MKNTCTMLSWLCNQDQIASPRPSLQLEENQKSESKNKLNFYLAAIIFFSRILFANKENQYN